jgi:hypothetical protein
MAWVLALTSIVAIGSPMPLGSLLGSKNATLDGQVPLPHTTLLDGDNLRVDEGLAMVTLDQGNRMVLGRQTQASFLREADAVTVSLTQGNLSLYHPQAGRPFRIKAGDVTVFPAKGYRTLGQIAMVDGFLAVTAKDGALQVEKGGAVQDVSKGKTITIATDTARAPMPDPQGRGKPHLKRIPPGLLIALGVAAGTAGIAWAIVNATNGGQPASPVTP